MGIINFAKNTTKQITPNFNVSEFKCKCTGTHDCKISEDLIKKIQLVIDTLNTATSIGCSKCIVSSGYRCSSHDKDVGGSGAGMHVEGMAADVVFFNNKGTVIDAKLIACIAQDVGFYGIGRINKSGYIHLDIRNGGYWYGDEVTHGNNNIPNFTTYYKHYGISKSSIYDRDVLPDSLIINGITYKKA